MGQNSKIEWTDHTFNPWWGCVKVSEGCRNCYAETQANRFGKWWGPNAERRFFGDKHWNEPLKWNEQAKKEGVRRKVFCGSMCDVFEIHPDTHDERYKLFDLIKETNNLIWLLLTKRPENIYDFIPMGWYENWPDNVWIGTSVENQKAADERIPELLKIPANVRFLSMEPLLGPVDLREAMGEAAWKRTSGLLVKKSDPDYNRIHWVIVGGESGQNARPMHPDWVLSIRDQCNEAGVPFFFKQWGEWRGYLAQEKKPDGKPHVWNGGWSSYRVGKKAAGRLLQGREWDETP